MTVLRVIARLKDNLKRIILIYLNDLLAFKMTTIFSNYQVKSFFEILKNTFQSCLLDIFYFPVYVFFEFIYCFWDWMVNSGLEITP